MNSTAANLPLVRIAGDPAVRGRAYGQQAGERVRKGLSNYQAAFGRLGISWDEACTIAGSFAQRLDAEMPDLLGEITGIAEGAGVEREEVLALNCRTEILYAKDRHRVERTDGCTGVVALPGITASGHLLHGQNWDWHDDCAETAVVLDITEEDGRRILTQTEAGIVARCGLNDSGIALTGNFLRCDRDNANGGIPIPFVRRRILEQTTLSAAMDVALNAPKSFSTNLMISAVDGECINFEAVPGETFWLHADDGLLVHANHFESAGALAKVRDTGLLVNPCTLYRSRRVREQLARQKGRIGIEHLKEALADRFGSPAAVCASPDKDPDGTTWSTVATILMDVTERVMWVAVRPYGEHVYTRYDFAAD